MNRPKHLECYGCEGGSGEGYYEAGFDVYVIDLFKHLNDKGQRVGFSQSRCPFPSYQGDVILALRALLDGDKLPFTHPATGAVEWLGLEDFDSVAGSPPCQRFSRGTAAIDRSGYPDLIAATRDLFVAMGLPYVIENVEDAKDQLVNPILLCGSMFGLATQDEDGFPLRLERHRMFESNFPLTAPGPDVHDPNVWPAGVYGGARRAPTRLRITSDDGAMVGLLEALPAKWLKKGVPAGWTVETITPTPAEDRFAARIEREGGYVPRSTRVMQELLGIDWMTKGGMAECIPPAYTRHIGAQLMAHVERRAA